MLAEVYASLLKDTDSQYSIYKRKKKNGKIRIITAPSEELKTLQSEFNDFLYETFKRDFDSCLHITGFVPDRNIAHNASVHLNKEWVVNIDLKDFFPSITAEAIEYEVFNKMKHVSFKNFRKEHMLALCCYQGRLPQGSPCSPTLANLVALFTIDAAAITVAKHCGFRYTRYADDLTFSTDQLVDREYVKAFTRTVVDMVNRSPYLKVNDKKINIKHRSQRQMVTGILVNNDTVRINKTLTNKLRAILHRHKLDDKPLDDKVSGVLGFIKQVNQEQFAKLTKDFPCKLLTLNSINLNSLTEAQKLLDSSNSTMPS